MLLAQSHHRMCSDFHRILASNASTVLDMWLEIERAWKARALLSNRSRPFSRGDWCRESARCAPSDHPNVPRVRTTIRISRGFSDGQWVCCSPFTPTAHSSRQNLLLFIEITTFFFESLPQFPVCNVPSSVRRLTIRATIQVKKFP